ncbi:MAG TPA: hypothetical protein VNT25_07360 [Allosphingosinicella sp.]|nr:hypothetical protein [Allosphingosinicella sp.]
MKEPGEDRRARQKSRALVMAIALAAFVILMYFITIAKMSLAG